MTWTKDVLVDVGFWGLVCLALTPLLHLLFPLCCLLLPLLLFLLAAAVCYAKAGLTLGVDKKAVVITGCDSGFGLALALRLHQMGFRVFACCLRAESTKDKSDDQTEADEDTRKNVHHNPASDARPSHGAKTLAQVASPRLHVLQMDVTSQRQLDEALAQVTHHLPKDEVLWGLVNNAGRSGLGFVEWLDLDTYREVAEVNIFGLLAATKTFLPLIRRARGRVVNVSSVAGCMTRAGLSSYSVTKYAVEAVTDCLREEMAQWGVSVSSVQPGNFSAGTNIVTEEWVAGQGVRMWAGMGEGIRADYGKDYFDSVMEFSKRSCSSGNPDVTPVVDALTRALTQRYPRARYRVVGPYYLAKCLAANHLPEWLFDLIYRPRPILRSCGKEESF